MFKPLKLLCYGLFTACLPVAVFAEQAPNPRAGVPVNAVSVRSDDASTKTGRGSGGNVVVNQSRAAATPGTVTRGVSARTARNNTTVNATQSRAAVARTAVSTPQASRNGTISSGASSQSRASSARAAASNVVRSAKSSAGARLHSLAGVSRAAMSRATAVFDDISKIGGGYAACRESYATCMDQFCANANDTYRRCFCSARFEEFRSTEAALDEAKALLQQFENNNLTAVSLSAAEVNAMYSATVGEQAIKNDTSAAAKALEEIGDLLSGRKKANTSTSSGSSSTSLGILSFDFSTDVDDIWGDGGNSIFSNSRGGEDLSGKEGQELYNSAHSQCLRLVKDSCESDAVLTMARSAYSIMITQDCNAYEKKVNASREAVEQTVRTAEKYLREARLEEYRAHNSADVNECISKVRSAMLADTACGADFVRCLDPTGAYINPSTGEPIYSPRLFELNNVIQLSGMSNTSSATGGAALSGDIIRDNPSFNNFLETKKMFANSALDTCRDISELVWEEFKRSAIIEIAQAQDEKIAEVKSSCVSVMAECYDTQSSALKDFDTTTAQATGALSAYAARTMCKDQVIACASLYGDTSGCEFDGNGRLVAGNAGSSLAGNSDVKDRCGLTELLALVDAVDTVRVAEGCADAIDGYIKQLCTPDDKSHDFPYLCRTKALGDTTSNIIQGSASTIAGSIMKFAVDNCSDPTTKGSFGSDRAIFDALPAQTKAQVERSLSNIEGEMYNVLEDECDAVDGYWIDKQEYDDYATERNYVLLAAFYRNVFGGSTNAQSMHHGACIQNNTMVQCLAYNTDDNVVASYDKTRDECTFTDSWYSSQCTAVGGYFEEGVCYIKKE